MGKGRIQALGQLAQLVQAVGLGAVERQDQEQRVVVALGRLMKLEGKGAETVRLIFRNLSALTQFLTELRGLYGSRHGRDGKHLGLEPRHARLAVGAAVAFLIS